MADDGSWSIEDGEVVCSQLGFEISSEYDNIVQSVWRHHFIPSGCYIQVRVSYMKKCSELKWDYTNKYQKHDSQYNRALEWEGHLMTSVVFCTLPKNVVQLCQNLHNMQLEPETKRTSCFVP